MSKICKFFVKGKCNDGENCKYDHVKNICKFHFFGICKQGNECKFSHEYKLDNKKIKKPKNTETFEPSHEPADLSVIVGNPYIKKFDEDIYSRNVILVPYLFCEKNNFSIYDNLLNEIKSTGKEEQGLWKLWHGDTHLIADDKLKWKDSCPTFCNILDRIAEYFSMEIKATRLNWYRDSTEWKPYHHDAAALKPEKAAEQNLTIGVSFGGTRDISFQHAKSKNVVTFPLPNGMLYGFSKLVNIEWRHGVPQLPPDKQTGEGRISVIAWGKTIMKD